jgi:hypothetical protein
MTVAFLLRNTLQAARDQAASRATSLQGGHEHE